MRERGQSAHTANTVGHSRSKMQHEIGGCLSRIASSPFGCACYVNFNPCGFVNAAALRSVLSVTALSLIFTNGPFHFVFLLCQASVKVCVCCVFPFVGLMVTLCPY